MATTNLMIQLLAEQYLNPGVTVIAPIEAEAFLFLDPNQNTVIRELAAEEAGGPIGWGLSGVLPVGYSPRAFVDVRLIPPQGDDVMYCYGPSFNPSPAVTGYGLAVLHVAQPGFSVIGGGSFVVDRAIGAHIYVDQTN